ncbi:MAG: hypothetical protein J3R72DRAFT_444483 [Linnemannia gamsii]|nr:MAG: hypothetical protein J3R72DRAFT_444483 [Linnemannia gamsii]
MDSNIIERASKGLNKKAAQSNRQKQNKSEGKKMQLFCTRPGSLLLSLLSSISPLSCCLSGPPVVSPSRKQAWKGKSIRGKEGKITHTPLVPWMLASHSFFLQKQVPSRVSLLFFGERECVSSSFLLLLLLLLCLLFRLLLPPLFVLLLLLSVADLNQIRNHFLPIVLVIVSL